MTAKSYEVLPGQGGFGIAQGYVEAGAVVKLTERQAKYLKLAGRVKLRKDIAPQPDPAPRAPRGRRRSKKPVQA